MLTVAGWRTKTRWLEICVSVVDAVWTVDEGPLLAASIFSLLAEC